jgi:hypothetical protein
MAAQPREESLSLLFPPMQRPKARPPQPRESGPAQHPRTGPGAEGGGGWPMHATAQPWHAEGLTLPTGALRRLQSPSAWQLTLSIEQQPSKQLLDAQGFSE